MTQEAKKYNITGNETQKVLTNCRIVWLHEKEPKKYSFTRLGQMFGMTSQRAHHIYKLWKTRPEVTRLVLENRDMIL